ncbi:hypothetical protein Q5425_35615 [Amycolatopsis sp. A133]|uniref:hypothetical protein n=1 Tax=Amycolatopsis sp. A133 TaxID=3064472 RepID=UPI0027E7FCAB|nr:hypothetical protein [Amycolatopsis sp. A133]MDQ7809084.1 hypothetical protein [Amycolatopsis sp. A133]
MPFSLADRHIRDGSGCNFSPVGTAASLLASGRGDQVARTSLFSVKISMTGTSEKKLAACSLLSVPRTVIRSFKMLWVEAMDVGETPLSNHETRALRDLASELRHQLSADIGTASPSRVKTKHLGSTPPPPERYS